MSAFVANGSSEPKLLNSLAKAGTSVKLMTMTTTTQSLHRAVRRLPRWIVALLGVLLLIVPILAKELPLMREQLPTLLDSLNATLKPFLAQWGLGVGRIRG